MLAGKIRAGATPLGDLAAEEFMLFVPYLARQMSERKISSRVAEHTRPKS
jgi:hypothetical protein